MTAEHETVLIFALGGETFALEVSHVSEIVDPLPSTPVPNASGFAPALVNVRGVVAPLVDLRARLALPPAEDAGDGARMLVLEVIVSDERTKLVASADAVESIVEISVQAIEPVPELGTVWPREACRGVVRRADGYVAVLDADQVFAPEAGLH